jgi:hypothetical protein
VAGQRGDRRTAAPFKFDSRTLTTLGGYVSYAIAARAGAAPRPPRRLLSLAGRIHIITFFK